VSSNLPKMAARQWPCLGLAALSCLLVFTTFAHAECAWVLWGSTAGVTIPLEGFANKEECRLREEVKRLQAKYAQQRDHVFRCLPDTIDPRAQWEK